LSLYLFGEFVFKGCVSIYWVSLYLKVVFCIYWVSLYLKVVLAFIGWVCIYLVRLF